MSHFCTLYHTYLNAKKELEIFNNLARFSPFYKNQPCKMVALKEDNTKMEGNPRLSIHPLLIDHVVEKILGYLVADQVDKDQVEGYYINSNTRGTVLLPYRLVCRLWNEIGTRLYNSHQQVEVGSYSTSISKFRRLIKLRKSSGNVEKGTKSIKNPLSSWPCLFSKFRLCQEVFQPMYSSIIADFFQTFHKQISVLDIWLDLRSTLAEVPVQVQNSKSISSSVYFPNLKILVYDDRRVVLNGCEDLRGTLLKTLCSLAPNLSTLSIRFQRDFRGSVEYSSDSILTNINTTFNNSQLQKSLKILKLDLHLNDDLLNSLKNSVLRISSLELAIRGSTFKYICFRGFLDSVQTHLRKLRLSFIERDSSCLISFPRMSALREFEIDGTDAFSKHNVAFGDFSYSENLPNLKSLRVNIWSTGNLRWGQFFQRKQPVLHLTELKLPGELCNKPMMATVASVFPNLRKLQISVYSLTLDAMEVIFECMKQLEELTVMKFPSLWDRNEKNIDHILTGISPINCDKLWRENVALNKITESQLAIFKTAPGITDMTCLRKLVMPDIQYQATYTDISGYLAFQRVPNLKYLNVGRSSIGNICLAELISKFPEMEAQRRVPPAHFKEPEEDDDDESFLELPGDTCVYL